jgi:hypothetical protein
LFVTPELGGVITANTSLLANGPVFQGIGSNKAGIVQLRNLPTGNISVTTTNVLGSIRFEGYAAGAFGFKEGGELRSRLSLDSLLLTQAQRWSLSLLLVVLQRQSQP